MKVVVWKQLRKTPGQSAPGLLIVFEEDGSRDWCHTGYIKNLVLLMTVSEALTLIQRLNVAVKEACYLLGHQLPSHFGSN